MKELRYSTKARKDLKRYRHRMEFVEELRKVLYCLQTGKPLPENTYPHKLTGQYAGCMECHVETDFLLIWIDEEANVIEVVRVGSHSELFGK